MRCSLSLSLRLCVWPQRDWTRANETNIDNTSLDVHPNLNECALLIICCSCCCCDAYSPIWQVYMCALCRSFNEHEPIGYIAWCLMLAGFRTRVDYNPTRWYLGWLSRNNKINYTLSFVEISVMFVDQCLKSPKYVCVWERYSNASHSKNTLNPNSPMNW